MIRAVALSAGDLFDHSPRVFPTRTLVRCREW